MYLWLLEIDDFVSSRHKIYYLKTHYPNILNEFKQIKFKEKLPFMQLFWHFLYNDIELTKGLCPMCGKRCNFEWRKIRGYRNHCSEKCYREDIDAKNDWKIKSQNTWNSKSIDERNEINNKRLLTYRLNFGKDNYSQTDEFKKQIDITWKNKTQDERNDIEIKRRITKSCKYNNETYNNGEKISKTLKNKPKEYWEERLSKSIQTCQKLYNTDFYSQTTMWKNDINDTWNNKSDEEIQNMVNKCQTTCQERYGFKSYSQSPESTQKRTKKIKYDNITFDSSWEVEVYKFCKEHNIPCEYQPNITLTYEYDEKIHYYHPDFLINGKLYEVKGDQFFEGDKMICPFNRDEYKDGIAEAKHQCMLKNGVIILRRYDIDNLNDEIIY